MAYPKPSAIVWDNPPGRDQGVTVRRVLADDREYEWYIPPNGVVTQAMAAELIGVSLMTVNNWVNDHLIGHIKQVGAPSVIPLREVKRVMKVRAVQGRLRKQLFFR